MNEESRIFAFTDLNSNSYIFYQTGELQMVMTSTMVIFFYNENGTFDIT